jgi:hypothetical protein
VVVSGTGWFKGVETVSFRFKSTVKHRLMLKTNRAERLSPSKPHPPSKRGVGFEVR